MAFGPVFSAFSLRAMAASTMLFVEWFAQLGMLRLIPTRLDLAANEEKSKYPGMFRHDLSSVVITRRS